MGGGVCLMPDIGQNDYLPVYLGLGRCHRPHFALGNSQIGQNTKSINYTAPAVPNSYSVLIRPGTLGLRQRNEYFVNGATLRRYLFGGVCILPYIGKEKRPFPNIVNFGDHRVVFRGETGFVGLRA